ncbi:g8370 [Coccomyxa viridis]|uniref:G8370 protein n=1 Tax=Coccomyxa viridis TaxID=1274662 RepID=A0ABP1G6M8_9CHLO
MLFAELYRSLKACFTRKQGKVSRVQNTRQSELGCSRGVPVNKARKAVQRKQNQVAARDCEAIPFAFTREYWLQRREALLMRLDMLYNETGDMELIDAAAASRRYVKEIQSGELRQDSRRMQVLTERLDALSGRLEQAVYDGVVPGGAAMFELIDQCNKILVHKGNGYNESPYVEPAHEVDHSAIAALLAQSAQSQHAARDLFAASQYRKHTHNVKLPQTKVPAEVPLILL